MKNKREKKMEKEEEEKEKEREKEEEEEEIKKRNSEEKIQCQEWGKYKNTFNILVDMKRCCIHEIRRNDIIEIEM